jgi:hypothetical protein
MDFYHTPAWCVSGVYEALDLPTPTLDPCAGVGGLVGPTSGRWSKPRGIEIQDHLARQARDTGLDVVTGDGMAVCWEGEHILMNPPYKDAMAWVEKGVEEAASVLALLRLGFLASSRRQAWWKKHPPSALIICSRRPRFVAGKGGDSTDYAWFYWTRQASFLGTQTAWIK